MINHIIIFLKKIIDLTDEWLINYDQPDDGASWGACQFWADNVFLVRQAQCIYYYSKTKNNESNKPRVPDQTSYHPQTHIAGSFGVILHYYNIKSSLIYP